jgi:hypothetical protein
MATLTQRQMAKAMETPMVSEIRMQTEIHFEMESEIQTLIEK